jgi:heme exporter protein D
MNNMNHAGGWMGGWSSEGMWIWAAIGVAVVVLLVLIIGKQSRK